MQTTKPANILGWTQYQICQFPFPHFRENRNTKYTDCGWVEMYIYVSTWYFNANTMSDISCQSNKPSWRLIHCKDTSTGVIILLQTNCITNQKNPWGNFCEFEPGGYNATAHNAPQSKCCEPSSPSEERGERGEVGDCLIPCPSQPCLIPCNMEHTANQSLRQRPTMSNYAQNNDQTTPNNAQQHPIDPKQRPTTPNNAQTTPKQHPTMPNNTQKTPENAQ